MSSPDRTRRPKHRGALARRRLGSVAAGAGDGGLNNGLADANAQAQRGAAAQALGRAVGGSGGLAASGGGAVADAHGQRHREPPGRPRRILRAAEAANELMGVVGIDGKLYRLTSPSPKGTVCVPAPEARGSRSNNKRESAFPPER